MKNLPCSLWACRGSAGWNEGGALAMWSLLHCGGFPAVLLGCCWFRYLWNNQNSRVRMWWCSRLCQTGEGEPLPPLLVGPVVYLSFIPNKLWLDSQQCLELMSFSPFFLFSLFLLLSLPPLSSFPCCICLWGYGGNCTADQSICVPPVDRLTYPSSWLGPRELTARPLHPMLNSGGPCKGFVGV